MTTPKALPCRHLKREPSCAFCRLADDPRYAGMFSGRPPAASSPCTHLGAPTGEAVACPSCRGGVLLKTFGCDVHGKCTLAKAAPGVACCGTCPDHSARSARPAEPMPAGHAFAVRDCLYHVMPIGGEAGQVWRQRLGMLTRRAALFNGTRLISCMTGPGLEPPSAVRALAEPFGFEVAEFPNDPSLREVVTLLALLPRFETSDPSRALWFGHAKGVTKPVNQGVTCHPWALICHEACLDYWPHAERTLGEYPIVGPFLKRGQHFAPSSRSSWHFSGSFFWARSADLFGRRPWRDVDRFRFGAESSPGVWYAPQEAGCLFHECKGPTLDLYRMPAMHQVAIEWLWWRMAHDHLRTPAEAVS